MKKTFYKILFLVFISFFFVFLIFFGILSRLFFPSLPFVSLSLIVFCVSAIFTGMIVFFVRSAVFNRIEKFKKIGVSKFISAKQFESLTKKPQIFEAIFEHLKEGILILKHDGTIHQTNQAFSKMFSVSRNLAGRPLIEVIRNATLQEMTARVLAGDFISGESIELRSYNQEPIDLEIKGVPFCSEQGSRFGFLFFEDRTELIQLQKIKEEFVANASHEIKTPLAAIQGYVETLLEDNCNDPETIKKFLEIIFKQTKRLGFLVKDLLDLSQLESKRIVLNREPLSVFSLKQSFEETFKKALSEKSLTLRWDIASEETLIVDQTALEVILSNLLENAIRASKNGAEILVGLRSLPNATEFVVSDQGVGILPDQIPKIFERFYRTEASRSRDLGGSGLGLAIVKKWVELHGGEIRVQSKVGEGTKFSFTLK